MKKFYFLLTLLFSVVGITQVYAQEDDAVVLEISKKTGNWTASDSPAYANEYATSKYSAEEITSGGVRIQHWDRGGGHRNNMYFYDGTNLGIYSTFNSTTSEDYRIYPGKGYYVAAISLDFIPGKHTDFAMNGVRVWANGDEDGAATSPNASTPGHYEAEFDDTEAEYIPLTIGQLAEGGNPIFAHTYNFTVTLKVKDPLDVAITDLFTLADTYSKYSSEGSNPFIANAGNKPGNYSLETVEAFEEAYMKCMDEDSWGNEFTAEFLKQLGADLVAAYDAVIASQITTMTVADGYYRIRTGINYNDGNLKYIYAVNNDGTLNGRWGTIEDLDNDCSSLFQVTNKADGSLDIVSMATDGRFNDNPGTLSLTSTNSYIVSPVATLQDETTSEYVTYVNIRRAGTEATAYTYIHQAGHSSGSGTGSNLTQWVPSYPASTTNGMGGSEWVIESVDAAKAEAIIAAFKPTKDRLKLLADFKSLLSEANTAVKNAKDIQEYNDLITDGSQFSSPWTEASEGVGKSGDWNELLDGNTSTFWHSDWHGGNVSNHTHWLEVTLNEPVYELIQMKITRRPVTNDHITLWGVYGANAQDIPDVLYTKDEATTYNEENGLSEGDEGYVKAGDVKVPGTPADWTKLASLATPYGNNTETKTSVDFDTQGFKYLRFYIDGTSSNRGYGHVSEFQLVIPVPNEKSQFVYMGEPATNLDALLKQLNRITEDAEITQEKYNQLVAAYDAFKAQFVDPTELRELLASIAGVADGVVVGTDPGYWPNASAGNALKATYDEAKAYDEAQIYAANKSNEYIETLKAQVEAVKDAALPIQEGKWYRIHFGSKADFEERGWDVETNDVAIVKDVKEEETETNEALWDKYFTVATSTSETKTIQVAGEPDGEGNPTTKNQDVTIYTVEPIENAEDVRVDARLYLDADADIAVKGLSEFRFVSVGDSAYVIQNRATGLFVRVNSGVKLDVIPSLFNVSALGYGQNLISASNLITGASQSNLHAQRTGNQVVTWSENVAGSRSALYIEEVGDVEADYEGSEFKMDIIPGAIHSFCYPVDLTVDEDNGQFYIVTNVEVTEEEAKVTLSAVEGTLGAGYPAFYIKGTVDNYAEPGVDKESGERLPETTETVTMKHGYSFVTAPNGYDYMRGTFSAETLGKGYIVSGGSLRDKLGQHASDEKRNQFYVTSQFITNGVPAYNAYVATEELLDDALTVTFLIGEDSIEDGIADTIKNVSRTGAIYSIDGRHIGNGNLNSVKRLGKGIYILNGAKVVVK